MVYFEEIYNFTRFLGGGVQPIPRGQTFSMGEGAGGPNAYSETHRTCDFPGVVRTLYPPSGSAHVTI